MALSFAQKVLKSKEPVVLFHTWTVTRELLRQALLEKRSMDLDVCVDDRGDPYVPQVERLGLDLRIAGVTRL